MRSDSVAKNQAKGGHSRQSSAGSLISLFQRKLKKGKTKSKPSLVLNKSLSTKFIGLDQEHLLSSLPHVREPEIEAHISQIRNAPVEFQEARINSGKKLSS